MKSIMSKLFTVVVTIMAAVNIVCGFFVVKGFYYLGPWLAWAGIFALICLFGSGIWEAVKKSGVKQKLRDMLDEDYVPPVKPDKKAVKKAEEDKAKETEEKAKYKMITREEYEAKVNDLINMYDEACEAGDTSLMKEIRDNLAVLKANEPPKIDKKKEKEDIRKMMGM